MDLVTELIRREGAFDAWYYLAFESDPDCRRVCGIYADVETWQRYADVLWGE